MLSLVPVPQRQGASESDLLEDDSKNEGLTGPTNESYSSKVPEEGLSHWVGNVVKTVLEGTQVRTQNHVDRPQEGPEIGSEAQAKVISVCKSEIHITNWVKVQSEDQYMPIVMRWNEDKKMNKLLIEYFLRNRIELLCRETSFCWLSNMASSGLKKMFI